MKRPNFFILLELPFDPLTNDPAQIKAAIHSKNAEWARLFSEPEHKSRALEYLQLTPEIEEVMLNAEKRINEAEEARKIRGNMASSFEAELRVFEAKGFVYPREVKALYEKYRPYGFDYALVKRLVRVPITDIPVKESITNTEVEALNYKKAKVIAEHLSIIGEETLYGFLGHNQQESVNNLYNSTSTLKNRLFNSIENTSEVNAKIVLCNLAIEVFENNRTKASYDTYLSINEYSKLNELIQKEFEVFGYISSDVLMRLVNFGIVSYGTDVIKVEEHIRKYCRAYNIDVNISAQHTTCPVCGHISIRGTAFCAECSSPLEGNCPGCNSFFTDGASSCESCGFPVGKMGLALPYVEEARQSLLENNWISATSSIHNVEKYWPNHKGLNNLKASLTTIKAEYEKRIRAIESHAKELKYYTAQKLIQHAQSDSFVVPGRLIEHVNNTILNFERRLEIFDDSTENKYNELTALSNTVVDSLDLNQLLSGSMPNAPDTLKYFIDNSKGTVSLEWKKSDSIGLVTYVLVRKVGSLPLTAFDGDILYTGENITFEDHHAEPLKKYFYSVFSKRGNAYSNVGAINVVPIIIIPKIENFTGTPADSSAQLNWKANHYVKQVKLWRTEKLKDKFGENPGESLHNMRIDSFTDTDLQNHHTYRYYAVGVYRTEEGDTYESAPASIEVMPNVTPIPVDQFLILATEEEDRYFISWEGPDKSDIIFFVSKKMPIHNIGQIVPIDVLMKSYEQLFMDMHLEKNGRFTLPFAGERYVFPVVVSGTLATVGRAERLTNLAEIKNITHEIIGDQLVVKFDWPEEASLVTLVWREDFFPKTVDQKGNQVLTFTKEEFQDRGAIRIPKLLQKSYYCRLFNTLTNEYNNVLYSEGVNIGVNNLPAKEFFYKLEYKTKLFSNIANVALTISSQYIFRLPKAYLVAKEGSMPISIHDGTTLFEIDREQDVAGSIIYKYRSEKLANNLYVRLFFENEKYYSELRPIPINLVINK